MSPEQCPVPVAKRGRIGQATPMQEVHAMRIGMLTGGGDCPGLNAVIRAVVRKGEGEYGHTIVGYRHGWRGVVDAQSIDLSENAVRGLLPRGGTILGTSRTNPYASKDGPQK